MYRVDMTKGEKGHMCATLKRKICGEKFPPDSDIDDHCCYIQPLPMAMKHTSKLIFYDFETLVNKDCVHVAFLVCQKHCKV